MVYNFNLTLEIGRFFYNINNLVRPVVRSELFCLVVNLPIDDNGQHVSMFP